MLCLTLTFHIHVRESQNQLNVSPPSHFIHMPNSWVFAPWKKKENTQLRRAPSSMRVSLVCVFELRTILKSKVWITAKCVESSIRCQPPPSTRPSSFHSSAESWNKINFGWAMLVNLYEKFSRIMRSLKIRFLSASSHALTLLGPLTRPWVLRDELKNLPSFQGFSGFSSENEMIFPLPSPSSRPHTDNTAQHTQWSRKGGHTNLRVNIH